MRHACCSGAGRASEDGAGRVAAGAWRALRRRLPGAAERQADLGAEQVAVGQDRERAVLQLDEAARDRQAEPAALRVAGGVAAHEALHQLLAAHVERFARDVAQRQRGAVRAGRRVEVDARAGQGVFDGVAEQVVEHAPEQAPVRQHHERGAPAGAARA